MYYIYKERLFHIVKTIVKIIIRQYIVYTYLGRLKNYLKFQRSFQKNVQLEFFLCF